MFQKFHLAATLCLVVILLTNCHNAGSKDESAKNTSLLTSIVQTQNLEAANAKYNTLSNSILAIQGYYDTGFYSNGTFIASTSKLIVSAGLNGVGTWASSTPTPGGTYGRCGANATDSNGTSGGADSIYRIIQFNNSTNTLILQTSTSCDFNTAFGDNRSTYSKMIVTALSTSGCENSAPACFSYCQITNGKATLAEAINDTKTANSALQTTTGCDGFGWNRALLRRDNNTWN